LVGKNSLLGVLPHKTSPGPPKFLKPGKEFNFRKALPGGKKISLFFLKNPYNIFQRGPHLLSWGEVFSNLFRPFMEVIWGGPSVKNFFGGGLNPPRGFFETTKGVFGGGF